MRHARLLLGFAKGGGDRRFALVARSTRQRPRAAVVAPRHPVLQQYPSVRVQGEQSRGAEAPPVPLPRIGDDPRVAGIARP